MRLQVVDINGKKAGTATVDDEVWGVEQNPVLVAQAVRVYQSNLRQGGGRTKNRSDINRTGRKMWKQKGTGRARHGDRTAPQFVGGVKAHGPTGQENYKLRINQKMRQGALRSVLSDAVRGGRVTVVEEVPKFKKTKELAKFGVVIARSVSDEAIPARLPRPDPGSGLAMTEKTLIVAEKPNAETVRAARNLDKVTLARPEELNALMALEHERLVITKEAIEKIKN